MAMPCYFPLKGWRSKDVNPTGKRSIVFNVSQGFRDMPVELSCGRCIGCRLERSRQWAIRMTHEASLYEENTFITLTYAPEHLPNPPSLNLKHFQDFMKRLRKRFNGIDAVIDDDGNETYPIRFFHCGEYGDQLSRPHYHAILFNFDFPDKKYFKSTKRGDKLYISESLNELWPFGYCIIGAVTFESTAYVARYITKKVTGDQAVDHYEYIDDETGEIFNLKPEYVTMSLKPGIGKPWLDKFKSDVFPHDEVIMRGIKMKPPRYYDGLYELTDPEGFTIIKNKRKKSAKKRSADNTPERLRTKLKVRMAKIKNLKRNYEND